MKSSLARLHAAVFLWGFTGVLGRLITLNEAWLVWWRMGITVISLWVFFFFRKQVSRVSMLQFLRIAAVGTLLSLHWVCFYGSVKISNVSIALTCLSTSGLFSAVIEPLFFRKRVDVYELVLGLFALAGIGVIYFSNLHFSTGIAVGLLSTLLTVLVSVLNKQLVTEHSPNTVTLYQLTGGFVGLSLLLPFYDLVFPPQQVVPVGMDWVWLLVLSWVCTIFTFLLYIRTLQTLSAFTVNLTLTLEPVYGIILAFIVYHENETLSKSFYAGFALVLVAVALQMGRLMRKVS